MRYAWPGNVRELENAIERAVVLARGSRIDVDDLPEEVGLALPGAARAGRDARRSPRSSATTSSRRCAPSAATARRAAAELGIGSATLYRKLKLYGESRA